MLSFIPSTEESKNACTVPQFNSDSGKSDCSSGNRIRINTLALPQFNVDSQALEKISEYLSTATITEKTFIHKKQSHLPFSLAYNPAEEKVYLKTKGLPPVGFGSSCNLVAGIDLNTRSKVVYRSLPTRDVAEAERKINIQLSERPDLFVAAKDIYDYQGSFRCKSPEDEAEKTSCKKVPKSKTCFILEYMDKDLYYLLEPEIGLSLQDKIDIACDIARALDVLHNEYKVVHRDLKVENIFISNLSGNKKYLAKIGDFGQSEYDGKVPKYGGGTVEYCPPEWLSNTMSITQALPRAQCSSDIWSFGVILLLLFGGHRTNVYWNDIGENREILALQSVKDKKEMIETIPKDGSERMDNIVSLIKSCLESDPKTRITIREVVEILENVHELSTQSAAIQENIYELSAESAATQENDQDSLANIQDMHGHCIMS